MRLRAFIQRVKSRPARFLVKRAVDAARGNSRWMGACMGWNVYASTGVHLDGENLTAINEASHYLAVWDKGLIVKPEEALSIGEHLDVGVDAQSELLAHQVTMYLDYRFPLLGGECTAKDRRVDWSRDFVVGYQWPAIWHSRLNFWDPDRPTDVKRPWELSRLQFIATLGRQYARNKDERLAEAARDLVTQWDTANPVGYGVNWVCGMEAAFRAIALIWVRSFFGTSRSLDTVFWLRLVRMLVEHGRYLYRNIEYSDINDNHYTACLLGLLYLSCVLPWYPESNQWRRTAVKGLNDGILTQTYPDGVTHEGSIPYHRLVLEMHMHAERLCAVNSIPVPDSTHERLRRMLEFTAGYTKPDGMAPLIGDNDDGRVLPLGEQNLHDHRYLLAIGAVRYSCATLKGAADRWWEEAFWITGLDGWKSWRRLGSAYGPASVGFPSGGFWFLRSGRTYAAIDCGDVGMRGRGGHGHADTLSTVVVICGENVVVDTGTHSYSADPSMRVRNVSAMSHNAVVLDDAEPCAISAWNMAEVSSYPCRGLAWDLCSRTPSFTGSHDGYLNSHGISCSRTVTLLSGDAVEIRDRVSGSGRHNLSWRWQLSSAMPMVAVDASSRVLINGNNSQFTIQYTGAELRADVEDSEYYPSYGVTERTKRVVLRTTTELPCEVCFRFDAVTVSVTPDSTVRDDQLCSDC
jgi:uncharacterized heparinase superfamily protein